MRLRALACDYDGTIATDGRIAPDTLAALERLRQTGRRVILVTGRRVDDLIAVCPELAFFDMAVAENGAVLMDWRANRIEELADPPPAAFLRRLAHVGVPFEAGRVVVATVIPHQAAVLSCIHALGLDLQIVFNKEAVMVLPSGVSKESGLRQALGRLGISPASTVAVGDGENDQPLLACVGAGVAVANAVAEVTAAADFVTRQPNGAGVQELVAALLRDDLSGLAVPPRTERSRSA